MTLAATSTTQCHSAHARALTTWLSITEPGDMLAGHLREELGAERTIDMIAEHAPVSAWATALGYQPEQLQNSLEYWQHKYDYDHVSRIIDQSQSLGFELIFPGHPHWPSSLNDLGPATPAGLWARGDASILESLQHSATIAGARAASSYGTETTAEIVEALANDSAAIVTGGSFGIEAQAIRTAICTRASTVTISAGGLDRSYPAAHEGLYENAAEHGAILSESPVGTTPHRWRFLQRNRLLAALSTGTIIPEAGQRSGAINTAAHASILGRALGAVPGPITSATSSGCHRIITEYSATLIAEPKEAVALIQKN